MRNRLESAKDALFSSYWFIPGAMSLGAALLAALALRLGGDLDQELFRSLGFVHFNEPEGARSLVSTIASSMITVAGTIFSITLAVLQLTSSQFGSRLLNHFMRDTGNQMVLGTFIATFIFCILVMRAIREGGEFSGDEFVPHLAVLLAILFALASLGVLVYFIHHTAQSIQASSITTRIAKDIATLTDKLYPEARGERRKRPSPSGEGTLFAAPRSGYLQGFDRQELVAFADRRGVVLEVLHETGAFLLEGQPLVRVWGALDEAARDELLRAFALGPRRTSARDLDFLFDELSEMALRALSKGINDPVTAMRCTDRIAEGIRRLCARERPTQYRGEGGTLRLIVPDYDLSHLVQNTLGEMRRSSADNMLCSLHLLSTLGKLLELTDDEALHRTLCEEARLIVEGAQKALIEDDYRRLQAHYLEVMRRRSDRDRGAQTTSA
jgi:uncharacterized membrane protein